MPERDSALISQIATDVKYLLKYRQEDKDAFEAHVTEDKQITKDFLRPLWEESQRRVGAAQFESVARGTGRFAINTAIAVAGVLVATGAAYAAWKGIK